MASKSASGLTAVLQSMGGRVLFVLINAATGVITARALHPAGRGELAALGVWPNFLGSLMTLGLPSAYIYWSRTEPESTTSLLWVSIPLTLILGALATVIGVAGIPFWLTQYSSHIVWVAQIFMLNAFIVLMLNNARAACEAETDFFASAVSLCLPPILALVGLIGLSLSHHLTPVTAAGAYVLSGVPTCFFLFYRLRNHLHGRPTHVIASARKLLDYGIRSYGVDICGTLSIYADQAIVIRLLAPEAMGTYVVALSLSRTLNVIHQAVASVLFPRAVSLQRSELIELTGRAIRISTAGTAVCGVGVALFGPFLLSLLYGREYRGATVILNILIVEMVITGATLVLTRVYMALGRPGMVTILQSSGLVLSLPLLMLLVPKWGVLGAAYALLTAAILRLAFTMMSFPIVLKEAPPGLLPRMSEFTVLAARLKKVCRSRIENMRRRSWAREVL